VNNLWTQKFNKWTNLAYLLRFPKTRIGYGLTIKLISMIKKVSTISAVWCCARTKPKQEHIAAANVQKGLGLEVFLPRIQFERNTRRGLMRTVEPLFPCYIFINAASKPALDEIRHTPGISTLVHFGQIVPMVSDSTISELKMSFEAEKPVLLQGQIPPGSEVRVGAGAFSDLTGIVLRSLPARKRVQILMDILGRPTVVEIDQNCVLRERTSLAALIPALAA
jgi:transcriptional antiterminator RfaH